MLRLIECIEVDKRYYGSRKFRFKTKGKDGKIKRCSYDWRDVIYHSENSDISGVYDRVNIYFDDETNVFCTKGEINLTNRYLISNNYMNVVIGNHDKRLLHAFKSMIKIIIGNGSDSDLRYSSGEQIFNYLPKPDRSREKLEELYVSAIDINFSNYRRSYISMSLLSESDNRFDLEL